MTTFTLPPRRTLDDAYNAGYDCGKHGSTEQNCHFALFASPEMTRAWERGKRDATQEAPHAD